MDNFDLMLCILAGIIGGGLLLWIGSEIFARIFFRYGEKFLSDKSNKLKQKKNEQEKK